jgi:hypothetical protein
MKYNKLLFNCEFSFSFFHISYCYSSISLRLKTDKQQQPQNYTEILEIPCIKDVNETASNAELELVVRIIDKISVQSD